MDKAIIAIFIVIILPISGILILTWKWTYKKYKSHLAGYILGLILSLYVTLILINPYLKPMILTNNDIHGTYIIDRDKFAGKQANWQYENFRFRITDNNYMIFESKIYDDKWKKEKIKVSYSSGYYDLDKQEYCNRKLRIHSDSRNHHIIRDNPTLYRKYFNKFYYVFESEKFGNVFFKKGTWNE